MLTVNTAKEKKIEKKVYIALKNDFKHFKIIVFFQILIFFNVSDIIPVKKRKSSS